jgi:hypothetical protein
MKTFLADHAVEINAAKAQAKALRQAVHERSVAAGREARSRLATGFHSAAQWLEPYPVGTDGGGGGERFLPSLPSHSTGGSSSMSNNHGGISNCEPPEVSSASSSMIGELPDAMIVLRRFCTSTRFRWHNRSVFAAGCAPQSPLNRINAFYGSHTWQVRYPVSGMLKNNPTRSCSATSSPWQTVS